MKTLFALIFLMLSPQCFAGNEGPQPVPMPPQSRVIPLVRCVPHDTALPGFELAEKQGCFLQPGGPRCGDKAGVTVLGFNAASGQWDSAGFIDGLPAADLSQAPGFFDYYYASTDNAEHLTIEISPGMSRVDAKFGVGFHLIPSVDTHGAQAGYSCVILPRN